MAALLVVAVIAGVVALDQRGNARAEATAAAAQRLGAQALAEDDLDRALLLARQGVALDDSPQTRGNLLAALLRSPAAVGVLRGDGDRLRGVALSPDERTLAFVDDDGPLSFVDTRTRRPAARPLTVSGVTALPQASAGRLRFSDDGSLLAVGGDQPVVLDARTHRVLARLGHREDQVVYSPALLAGRAHAVRRRGGPAGREHHDPALRRAQRPAARRGARGRPRRRRS